MSDQDILHTINMSDDLESQTINLSDKFLENYHLKGILKKQSSFAEEKETLIINRAAKICSIISIIILFVPIIFCDLYYGFTDNSCINEMPNGLNYTMKIYLLTSGFIGLIVLLISIWIVCLLSYVETNFIYIKYFGMFGSLFQIIWNILGSATFWGTIYKEENCDSMISTYIFISLIIKLVGNLFSFIHNFNNK
jgi:hypothetical protein